MSNDTAVPSLRQLLVDKIKEAEMDRLVREMDIVERDPDFVVDSLAKSRRDAKHFRSLVLERADWKCEVCHFDGSPVCQVHHVKAVKRGGGGFPGNLITLCPNCHSVVTAIQETTAESRLHQIEYWLYESESYTPDQSRFLIELSYENVTLTEDGWGIAT